MNVAVIGAGAWGTAFSMQLAGKGHTITLWAYEPELCRAMKETRENGIYLPGFRLPAAISFTEDLNRAAQSADTIVIATPSFALRPTLVKIAEGLKSKKVLVLTKGLETHTLLTVSQVAQEVLERPLSLAVLSGPSFAQEVANRVFTSVVVASVDKGLSHYFQEMSHDERFRVYTSQDVVGVELGGALKNVMAIGAGIIEGLKLGHNTLAAYVTRALAEMKRLGASMGARETTFMGLSGMGDLILTCTGPLSRNRMFGMELAKGKDPREVIESQKAVVEGFYTIDAAYRFSKRLSIEMPITEELYRVVYEGKDIRVSFEDICRRAIREEDG
ncbi:MAG TPA: NAD(P)H-dependent glycerol-3-phosphate dehydrogenase [Syntrophorhabdales bacterium]|nr:NAD(P)H-dependent glycerol-3-phosphate dehydrogenase [Syntrophorhabdales bacterium]